jgi:hypothetical protein
MFGEAREGFRAFIDCKMPSFQRANTLSVARWLLSRDESLSAAESENLQRLAEEGSASLGKNNKIENMTKIAVDAGINIFQWWHDSRHPRLSASQATPPRAQIKLRRARTARVAGQDTEDPASRDISRFQSAGVSRASNSQNSPQKRCEGSRLGVAAPLLRSVRNNQIIAIIVLALLAAILWLVCS